MGDAVGARLECMLGLLRSLGSFPGMLSCCRRAWLESWYGSLRRLAVAASVLALGYLAGNFFQYQMQKLTPEAPETSVRLGPNGMLGQTHRCVCTTKAKRVDTNPKCPVLWPRKRLSRNRDFVERNWISSAKWHYKWTGAILFGFGTPKLILGGMTPFCKASTLLMTPVMPDAPSE